MANVTFFEGWGLYEQAVEKTGPDLPAGMAEAGWVNEPGSNNATDITIADGQLTMKTSTTGAGTGWRFSYPVDSPGPVVTLGVSRSLPADGENANLSAVSLVAVPNGILGGYSDLGVGIMVQGPLSGGTLQVRRRNSAGGVTQFFTDTVMPTGVESWVEVVWDTSTGSVQLWLNQELLEQVQHSDLVVQTSKLAVVLGQSWAADPNGSLGASPIGPIYVADERLGRCQVITRRPDADANVQFTRTQGDSNASQVADPTGFDGDASFVSSDLVNGQDLYSSSTPLGVTNERIHAVSALALGRREDIGTRGLQPVVSSGGVVAQGATTLLPLERYAGNKSVFASNPANGGSWSASAVEDSTFGMRLTE